ncbi:transposable element Tcb2 transposase [Trichonephila clavipes]|nr:transposable element Tcb2 transposase [Trichonephila clavipes]
MMKERHNYRGAGIMAWTEVSLTGQTDLHVIHGGVLTGMRYRGRSLIDIFPIAIGNEFIVVDDNARNHRAVEDNLQDYSLERMATSISKPESNRAYLGLPW